MNLADIIALLRQEIGLNPDSIGEGAVRQAVQRRLAATACRDLTDYGARLASSVDEIQELVEQVTVTETWFFREESAFECLRQQARSTFVKAPLARPFQVASLPCSTGEEPYSIAMVLLDLGLPALRFRVHALDVNYRALLRAQQAVYGDYAFRNADNSFRAQHFEVTPTGYRLSQAVRDQVSFFQGNVLALPSPFASGTYDVVFSRNVLIYLDQQARERMVAELKRVLSPTGILLAGHAEVSMLLQAGFVRRADGALLLASDGQSQLGPLPVGRGRHGAAAASDSTRATKKMSSYRSRPLVQNKASALELSAQTALAAARPNASALDETDAIRALANAGQLEQARLRGEQQLAKGQRSAELYCVMGLISRAQGNALAARDCYRKAVYLDPQHDEASLQLAMLLEQGGEGGRARSMRQRIAHANQTHGGLDDR